MNNTADNLSATTGCGIVIEDPSIIASGLITLIDDVLAGIDLGAEKHILKADLLRARERAVRLKEVAK